MTPEEKTKADAAWQAFVAADRDYAQWLDQWDKFKFDSEYGPVYVSIGRSDPYPDSFDPLLPPDPATKELTDGDQTRDAG